MPQKHEPVQTFVVKRDGHREPVSFDKVTARISRLSDGLSVDPILIAGKVIQGIFPDVHTAELDDLAVETAAALTTKHPDYAVLAARIAVSNLHKQTPATFSDNVCALFHHKTLDGAPCPLISEELYDVVMMSDAGKRLDAAIDDDRDLKFTIFGFKTMERTHLLRSVSGKVMERPQYMFMRVALGIHGSDIDKAIETYDLMSKGFFTHATPTLINSGTDHNQLSSCFLLTIKGDSIDGIYSTLKDCAMISKSAGGIGLAVSDIRAKNSYITGTNGFSNGLVPMLRVFDATARYVDQGGNKRPGAFALFLEPWHADIFEFLQLKKNTGAEVLRARDLFYGLWIPDLFMKRVEADQDWTLMCPHRCPGLTEAWGPKFEELYTKYESEGRGYKVVKAQQLWFAILESQTETGTPYMCYKDAANRRSNQQHSGTIRCSNLCTEIMEISTPDEAAVCNLASLALPAFINEENKDLGFEFEKLHAVTKIVTRNLNTVIDRNMYPIVETKRSNMRHRPIGIGIQGLADTFCILKLPFVCAESKRLNREIFETIYHAALEASCELAQEQGPYPAFKGSPASHGILQYDMCLAEGMPVELSGRWDWRSLKAKIQQHGLRNSLFVAPMPTASTSQILGNNECFEPFTSNLYARRVLSGEFQVVNRYLLEELVDLGIWNDDLKNLIVANKGSVQNIVQVPKELQERYKTVWEISQRDLIDMAAERVPFIDQSQSLNLFVAEPTNQKLTSMHFYAWRKGLKTGMYYLRTRPAADAIAFTVDQAKIDQEKRISASSSSADKTDKSDEEKEKQEKEEREDKEKEEAKLACSRANPEGCLMCSS